MTSKIRHCLNYLLLAISVTLLSGCETLPAEKNVNPMTLASTSVATAIPTKATQKPKRIKPQMTIEYVTCDPARAKELQAEIDARAAKRLAMVQTPTS